MTQTTGLAAALAAVQAELPDVAKDKTAKVKTDKAQYSYRYADLATISRIVLPVLGKHGLAWTTRPTLVEGQFVLAYKLAHSSGEIEEGSYPLPDPVRSSPQAVGSAITYARRYALCSITGVAPDDDDDDAAQAQAYHQQQRSRPAEPPPANGQQTPAAPAAPAPPHPNIVRDWALGPDRTADSIDQALRRLHEQHPRVAAATVTNEHGDEEQLQTLMARRARELTPAGDPPATAAPAEAQQSDEERRRKRLHALTTERGYKDRTDRLTFYSMVVGRDVASSKELRWPTEVERVISALEQHQTPQPEGAPA